MSAAWEVQPGALSSETPVLRSGQEGQVMFDSQQGCSLPAGDTWSAMYTSGSPRAQPWGAAWWGQHLCVELVMAKPPSCSSPGHVILQLQPHQELLPLSQVGSVSCVWKLQLLLRESILKEPNCLRFYFTHISEEVLESKAFIHVFISKIFVGNTALVKGRTFSKYIPPLKLGFSTSLSNTVKQNFSQVDFVLKIKHNKKRLQHNRNLAAVNKFPFYEK